MTHRSRNKLPSRLGVKLPPTNATGFKWKKLLAPFDDPLQFLFEVGVDYVEYPVGHLDDNGEAELIYEAASACGKLGMGVAIHPYVSGKHNPANYSENSPCHTTMRRALHLAKRAHEATGKKTIVVFHPAAMSYDAETDLDKLRQRLLDRSRAFARELERESAAAGPGVMAVLEHQVPPNPDEQLIRIADNFEALLAVTRDTSVPLCWDTGHYLLAVERHGQDLYPPQEFVDRVEHVHLHAVTEGRDHRPVVTESEVPRNYLQSLWRRGFTNGITLEYSVEGLDEAGGLKKVVEESASLLRKWSAGISADEIH